eukprot:13744858-Alexandrium_andersonii.AAC.1
MGRKHRTLRRGCIDRSDRSTERWPGVVRLTGGFRAGAGTRRAGARAGRATRSLRGSQARLDLAVRIR